MRSISLLLITILLSGGALLMAQNNNTAAGAPKVITLDSPAPLYTVRIMVRAGSADDPVGKEGTANLVADALIDAGFGDAKSPVTKERLAEITRPWGSGALPSNMVDKQTTTFMMTVPRDAFPQFVSQVLRPMMTQPLWTQAEIDRLKTETLTGIRSRLRFEEQENLGLQALDNSIFAGTRMGHLSLGSVKGIQAITREDLANFYKRFYTAGNMSVAISTADPATLNLLRSALPKGAAVPRSANLAAAPVEGREVLIVTQPNAIATGIHFGFPISVKRGDADYWPLYIANAFLGQHRDSFGRLYNEIREERGYNYGDYTYLEYLPARPYTLFPPPNAPRTAQYYSVWIRPVGHQYAHFILKAATAELERFVREGLTPAQVEEAKVKVKTLYLNFAESTSRRLGYALDDQFYGLQRGYLDQMLQDVDKVTAEQVNAAIKRHLQTANLKYVIVTNTETAQKLATDIPTGANVVAKTLEEYHINEPVPPAKQEMLKQDEEWKKFPLNVAKEKIRIVPALQMFETAELPGTQTAGGQQ